MHLSRLSGRALITAAAVAVCLAASPILLAQEQATLQGVLLDPSGNPAAGFRAVIVDIVSTTEYTSPPSNAAGEYTMQVPSGTRYRIVAGVAPDGTRLPVQAMAPMPVRVPGTYRLPDVMFVQQDRPQAAAPTPSAPTPKPSAPATTKVGKPWYKTPGGVVGIVAGSIAVIALAADDGGTSSPSNP